MSLSLDEPPPAAAQAKAKAERSLPNVKIFQNYYSDEQQELIDPAFVPHDGRKNARTDYREVGLFLRMFHSGLYRAANYTGIVSPKFQGKTCMAGEDFIRFIENNPGYDAYFINPYPCNAYYSFNVWTHGEINHIGLMVVAQELFDRAGLEFNISRMGRNSLSTVLYCNYWAGNESFWQKFMELHVRLLDAVDHLPEAGRRRLFTLDPRYPDPVPMLPFIFERLFSTLLHMDPSIKALGYPHSREYIIRSGSGNLDEPMLCKSFIDIIDEIDRRGEYDARDRQVFRALERLKRHLLDLRLDLWYRPK